MRFTVSGVCKKKVEGSSLVEGGQLPRACSLPGSTALVLMDAWASIPMKIAWLSDIYALGLSLGLLHSCTHEIQVPEGNKLQPEIQKTKSLALNFMDQLSVLPTT